MKYIKETNDKEFNLMIFERHIKLNKTEEERRRRKFYFFINREKNKELKKIYKASSTKQKKVLREAFIYQKYW